MGVIKNRSKKRNFSSYVFKVWRMVFLSKKREDGEEKNEEDTVQGNRDLYFMRMRLSCINVYIWILMIRFGVWSALNAVCECAELLNFSYFVFTSKCVFTFFSLLFFCSLSIFAEMESRSGFSKWSKSNKIHLCCVYNILNRAFRVYVFSSYFLFLFLLVHKL